MIQAGLLNLVNPNIHQETIYYIFCHDFNDIVHTNIIIVHITTLFLDILYIYISGATVVDTLGPGLPGAPDNPRDPCGPCD